MRRRTLIIGLVLGLALGAGWYLFRPERLFVSARVQEDFPAGDAGPSHSRAGQPVALARGEFHGVAHRTKGTATIYKLADGRQVLRLTDFETSNGPDVHVYLIAAEDAKDNETVTRAGFIALGSLKGNIGDQNYDLRVDLDLAKYRAVTI